MKTAALLALSTCALFAQNPTVAEMKTAYTAIKNNLTRMAEKMPADQYDFKPVNEIRSFGALMAHVADSQLRTCSSPASCSSPLSSSSCSSPAESCTRSTPRSPSARLNAAGSASRLGSGTNTVWPASSPASSPSGQLQAVSGNASPSCSSPAQPLCCACHIRQTTVTTASS